MGHRSARRQWWMDRINILYKCMKFPKNKISTKKKKKAGSPFPGHFPCPSLQTSGFPCSVDKFKEMLYQKERRDSILTQVSGRPEQVISVFSIPEHLQTHLTSIYGHDKIRKRNSILGRRDPDVLFKNERNSILVSKKNSSIPEVRTQ